MDTLLFYVENGETPEMSLLTRSRRHSSLTLFLMRHALHFLVKPPYGSANMVARCAAAALVASGNFMLRYALEKGQVQHFPLLFGQAGEGFDKWGVAENNGIAAYCQQVFFLRLRCIEIFIFCAEWVVLLVCEVVKGYFSFVFPVPRPNRRIHGVADNNSTKGMECVNDMLLVFFCTGHGNFPLSSTNAWIEI